MFRFLNPFSPRTLCVCRNQNVSFASKTPSICTCAAAPQEQNTGAFFFSKLSFFLSVLDFILFLCFYFILFVKFTKHKSPAMQILQSFKLVTYFQRFVINSPQNTDKFRAEKIEALWNRKKIQNDVIFLRVFYFCAVKIIIGCSKEECAHAEIP